MAPAKSICSTNATTEVERKKYSIGGLAAATISNEVAINLVIDLVQQ
jgi:hypothetical protein